LSSSFISIKTGKNTIVECLVYQIPVIQLKGPKRDADIQAAKGDYNGHPTHDLNIWLCGRKTVSVANFFRLTDRYWREKYISVKNYFLAWNFWPQLFWVACGRQTSKLRNLNLKSQFYIFDGFRECWKQEISIQWMKPPQSTYNLLPKLQATRFQYYTKETGNLSR